MAQNRNRKSTGIIMLLSGIVGFILDAFLVSNLMVIQGNTAVIVIGFLLAILLFLLSIILTISGIAMLKEVRRIRKSAINQAMNPGMIMHADAIPSNSSALHLQDVAVTKTGSKGKVISKTKSEATKAKSASTGAKKKATTKKTVNKKTSAKSHSSTKKNNTKKKTVKK